MLGIVLLLVALAAAVLIATRLSDRELSIPVSKDAVRRTATRDEPVPPGAPGDRVRPAGSPQSWVTDDDYPPEALRRGEQGTVAFTLEVDPAGKPSACHVTQSSGHAVLDRAACTLLTQRARFVPARDAAGIAIPAKFRSRFTWRIPGVDPAGPEPIEVRVREEAGGPACSYVREGRTVEMEREACRSFVASTNR
jgi:TonB family protein